MSERDDGVRGDYPAGALRPRRNGLLPEDSANSALPADLAAVQADDALLDALGGLNPSPEGSDARLAQVLMAWRREVDSEPITRVMDTDTALAVVARARRPERRRSSGLVSVAAAAVLAIAFSGVGLGARAAEPGDRLWPLTKVLFSSVAESKQAAAEASEQLQQADTALAEGRPEDADAALLKVEQELAAIPPDDKDRAGLEAMRDELKQRLESQSNTDDPDGATGSDNPGSEAASPDERATATEDSTGEETSSPTEETSSPTEGTTGQNPSTGSGQGTGATEGGDSEATPQNAPPPPPPPRPPPPPPPPWFVPPALPAPPASFPES